MFARSIALLGAATLFAGLAGADAQAFGKRHGCCQPKTCYKKVVSPPVYKTVMKKVMVRPERCSKVRTPPVYETRRRRVMVKPERRVVHRTPPVYDRVKVRQKVRPGYTRWKTRRGCCGVEYKCAVHVPPKFRTRKQRVKVREASSRVEVRPAVYKTVKRKVMVRPGRTRRVCEPPVYRTVPRKVMVRPGKARWVPVRGCGY